MCDDSLSERGVVYSHLSQFSRRAAAAAALFSSAPPPRFRPRDARGAAAESLPALSLVLPGSAKVAAVLAEAEAAADDLTVFDRDFGLDDAEEAEAEEEEEEEEEREERGERNRLRWRLMISRTSLPSSSRLVG